MSGGGKSTALEELKRDLVILNPKENFDILSFEFEMPSKDNFIRSLSALVKKSTKILYSVTETMSEQTKKEVEKAAKKISKFPIYIVDIAGRVGDIYETILEFVNTRNHQKTGRGLVVTLDHTLLTKGFQGESEKQIVDELMKMIVGLRKELMHKDIKSIFVVLSQLNRDIESKLRVLNPMLHYPIKNDIFAASSVYYCCDLVIVSHKPATIAGISQHYGPPIDVRFPRGLPVYNPKNPDQAMVYWHIIKNRFGDGGIIPMLDRFDIAKLVQTDFNSLI